MQIKWQYAAALVGIAFFIGVLISYRSSAPTTNGISHEKQVYRMRFDTAKTTVAVPVGRIRLRGPMAHKLAADSTTSIACLDTILRMDTTALAPDTLSVCFARDTFSLRLGFSPRQKEVSVPYIAHDTFYSQIDTIRIAGGSSRAWYDDALIIILSIAAGIILGRL